MEKPSVGRDVHYVSYGTPGGEYASQCRAAKITEVEPLVEGFATQVHLVVFNPTGILFDRCPQDETDKSGGTWHWPERV